TNHAPAPTATPPAPSTQTLSRTPSSPAANENSTSPPESCLPSFDGHALTLYPPTRHASPSLCVSRAILSTLNGGPMSSTPQFGTAEYKSATGSDRCKRCQQELTGTYFRMNCMIACEI